MTANEKMTAPNFVYDEDELYDAYDGADYKLRDQLDLFSN